MIKRFMTWLCLTAFLLAGTGCSTIEANDLVGRELQDAIRSGELVATGDYVVIQTIDGSDYEFPVIELTDVAITGKEVSVPIEDIAEISVKRVDYPKSAGAAALTGAGLLMAYRLLFVIVLVFMI